jgi:predicted small lipoprotein YifL
MSRLAVGAVLVLALGLAACGRKGPLDPPPSATAPAQGTGQPAAALGPDGKPMPHAAAQPKRSDPFFLDWLID